MKYSRLWLTLGFCLVLSSASIAEDKSWKSFLGGREDLAAHCESLVTIGECLRVIETAQIPKFDQVSRNGSRLYLKLLDGGTATFQNGTNRDGETTIYSFLDYLESKKGFLIHLQSGNESVFLLIGDNHQMRKLLDRFPRGTTPDQ